MVSKTIEVNSGEKVTYKVIKDGYKTVTEEINITADMPAKNNYDLEPSSEQYVFNSNYNIVKSAYNSPVMEFNEPIITPDGMRMKDTRYVLEPFGKNYVLTGSRNNDTFSRVGNVKVYPNGMVTNFSTSSYLLTKNLLFGTDDYEIIFGFEINENVNTNQCMFHSSINYRFNISTTYSKSKCYLHTNSGDGSSWTTVLNGVTPLSLSTKYLVKVVRTSGVRHMYLSSDNGESWSDEGSIADTNSYSGSYNFGCAVGSNQFYGKIYLEDTSITIDNNPVDLNWNIIPNNVNVFGTMRLENAVTKTTFSNTNYLDTMPKEFTRYSGEYGTWEWVFKVEKFIHSSSIQMIYGQGRSYESGLHINTNDTVYILLNNTANTTYFGSIYGSTVLQEGKSYWIKVEFTGTEYKLWLSEDNVIWNQEGELKTNTRLTYMSSDNWHIGWNYHGSSDYWYPTKSELNIAESYIKANGEYWWRGADLFVRNYGDVQNSLRVEEGDIATNFSNSNRILAGTTPPSPVESYEFVIKFKASSFTDGRLIGNVGTNKHSIQLQMKEGSTSSFWYGHPSKSYSWQSCTIPQSNFLLNKWNWIKGIYNANDSKVILYSKTELEEDYSEVATLNTTGCGWNQQVYIGCDQGDASIPSDTLIDLKESYIKINGNYWWCPVYGPVGESLSGVLDPRIEDPGNPDNYNLYDIQTDSRGLILSKDRGFEVDNFKFAEYLTSVSVSEYHPFAYNEQSFRWEGYISTEISVDDPDAVLHIKIEE